MKLAITVTYYSDHHGAGKLRAVAKGAGIGCRQLTIGYPHHLPSELKYWRVTRVLSQRLEGDYGWQLRLLETSKFPGVQVFTFEVFDQTVGRFDNDRAIELGEFPAGN